MPKFLIIRFSSIGDIVLTSPVVRCLKKQVPDAEVHFLTKKSFKEITEYNPHIDKTILLENKLTETVNSLKKENYDYVIDLHRNLRTFFIKRLLGKKSFSFNKLNIEKWLMVNFKINRLPNIHIVDRYLDAVKTFGVKNDLQGLDFFIKPGTSLANNSLPVKYIGFVIGAKHNTKKLPPGKIISICKKINLPVVLIGGNEDDTAAEEIVSILKTESNQLTIVNACGKFSISESALIIKNAEAIITHDTGMMHIAAAMQKKIISVWGNTIPEFGMTPYYGSHEIQNTKHEIKNLHCRPCSKIGYDKCPRGHFKCMMEINDDEVAATAKKLF